MLTSLALNAHVQMKVAMFYQPFLKALVWTGKAL